MIKKQMPFFILMVLIWQTSILFAEQTIISKRINLGPAIDGKIDNVWDNAEPVITHDSIAGIDVTLKSVYTDNKIFFLVNFHDKDESRIHKSWVWNKEMEIYNIGKDREDVFVFKWNMEPEFIDLSIYADNQYKADIWYWKACRTDPRGYADDKLHVLTFTESKDAHKLTSKKKKTIYLFRNEDQGSPAFKTKLYVTYKGDILPRFFSQEPTNSRADVKAKGFWKEEKWTIEFSRKLETGNADDVQFDPKAGKKYQFGISRYEIAGLKSDPQLSQPLFGCGDIFENLILVFENK